LSHILKINLSINNFSNLADFPCLGAQAKPEKKKLGFKEKRHAARRVLGFQVQLASAGSVADRCYHIYHHL
jgi:hypothetical protein